MTVREKGADVILRTWLVFLFYRWGNGSDCISSIGGWFGLIHAGLLLGRCAGA